MPHGWPTRASRIEEDRQKAFLTQVQAKGTAAIAITPAVDAAAATLHAVTQAQKAHEAQDQKYWDNRIKEGVSYIDEGLNHFSVSESVRDLGGGDRLIYVGMIGRLRSFVAINKHPSEHLDRAKRLQNQYLALMKLRDLLAPFDSELAARYDIDAGIAQQS